MFTILIRQSNVLLHVDISGHILPYPESSSFRLEFRFRVIENDGQIHNHVNIEVQSDAAHATMVHQ